MKKILSFVLVLAMLCSLATFSVFAEDPATITYNGVTYTTSKSGVGEAAIEVVDLPTGANGANEQWTVIRDMDDFRPFGKITDATGEEHTAYVYGGRYILANDIDCSVLDEETQELVPSAIDNEKIQLGRGAILDGNGYSIYNFCTLEDEPKTGRNGIFKIEGIDEGENPETDKVIIRNLTFGQQGNPVSISNALIARSNDNDKRVVVLDDVDVHINLFRDGGYPATFVAQVTGNYTFKNCDVRVYTEGTATNSGSCSGAFIGSVEAGNKSGVTFENCTASGTMMTRMKHAGGFIGVVSSTVDTCKITFKNCANYINVSSSANKAGGFIGEVSSSAISLTFENCVNYGNITGSTYAGGFIGSSNNAVTFTNCVNLGNVTSQGDVGGILGSGAGAGTFTACINNGEISMTNDSGKNAGGIVGSIVNGVWNDCINFGEVRMDIASASASLYACGNLAGTASGDWEAKNNYGYGALIGENVTKGVMIAKTGENVTSVAEGNKYIQLADENLIAADEAGKVEAAAAATEMKTLIGVDCVLGDYGTPVLAAPTLKAVQNTAIDTTTNTQKIRFVGVIDTMMYKEVGFKISYTYTNASNEVVTVTDRIEKCSSVFNAVKSANGTTSAEDLSGKYIFALALTDVPTNVGEITFTVTPFATTAGEAGVTYEGGSYTVTYNNGVFVD